MGSVSRVGLSLNCSLQIPLRGLGVDGPRVIDVQGDNSVALLEIPAAGGYTAVKVLANGFNAPIFVAVDPVGIRSIITSAKKAKATKPGSKASYLREVDTAFKRIEKKIAEKKAVSKILRKK